MKRILFSPIGNSDPVNAGYDGSWIHCCRKIKPDLTVIYLSAEMDEKEKSHQIYSRTLHLLNEKIGTSTELRIEHRPNLTSAHLFDAFYKDFETILINLHNEYPDAELYVNVSSGTPAMKSCLTTLSNLMLFPMHLIQVDAPPYLTDYIKGKKDIVPNGENYDVEENWDNNLDNLEVEAKRAHQLDGEQQMLRILRKQIETLVDNNEFCVALLLANAEAKDFISESAKQSLKAAAARMNLNLREAVTKFNGIGYKDVWSSNEERYLKSELFRASEMILTMKADLDRNDIGNCLRKLTPVLLVLANEYLITKGIDFQKEGIVEYRDNEEPYLNINNLEKKYPDLYKKGESYFTKYYKYGYSSATLISILDFVDGKDDKGADYLKQLRRIEKLMRNKYAHELVYISPKEFNKIVNCTAEDVMAFLVKTVKIINPQLVPKEYWSGYDKMKAFIKSKLHEA